MWPNEDMLADNFSMKCGITSYESEGTRHTIEITKCGIEDPNQVKVAFLNLEGNELASAIFNVLTLVDALRKFEGGEFR